MGGQINNKRLQAGISLADLLIVITIIAVISAFALPVVSRVFQSSTEAKDRQNAKLLSTLSASLSALGVAHVMPDSLGGVKATARLLREGVVVSEGAMAGEKFIMAALSDNDIDGLEQFLKVRYGVRELSLVFYERPQIEGG